MCRLFATLMMLLLSVTSARPDAGRSLSDPARAEVLEYAYPASPKAASSDRRLGGIAGLTGMWWNPAMSGQGVQLMFAYNAWGVTFYTYDQGRQLFLVGGHGPEYVSLGSPDETTFDLFRTAGTSFPPAFDPAAVRTTPWGKLGVKVLACDRIRISWQPTVSGFTLGSMDLVPLITPALGLCAKSSLADPHPEEWCHAPLFVASPHVPYGQIAEIHGAFDDTNDRDVLYIPHNAGLQAQPLDQLVIEATSIPPPGFVAFNPEGCGDAVLPATFRQYRQLRAGSRMARVVMEANGAVGPWTVRYATFPASVVLPHEEHGIPLAGPGWPNTTLPPPPPPPDDGAGTAGVAQCVEWERIDSSLARFRMRPSCNAPVRFPVTIGFCYLTGDQFYQCRQDQFSRTGLRWYGGAGLLRSSSSDPVSHPNDGTVVVYGACDNAGVALPVGPLINGEPSGYRCYR